MEKYKNIMLGVLIFLGISIVSVGILFNIMISPVNKNDNNVIDFEIQKGNSTRAVAKSLKEKGLIRSEAIVLVYSKIYSDLKVREGTYQLNKTMSLDDILKILDQGANKNTVNITLREGETITDLAKSLVGKLELTEEEFLTTINDKSYVRELIEKYWFLTDEVLDSQIYYSLEGYLFPETHNFYKTATAKQVIEKYLDGTKKILDDFKDGINQSKYTIHEILTLASTAEKEGKLLNDKKDIVGTFINRMQINMKLGSDVTSYYAFKKSLSEPFLAIWNTTYNPYNTRGPRMEGKLPVGPINNPSKTSIEAAVLYNKNNYYYFVADKNMKVHFMKTEKEFYDKIEELKQRGMWN